MTTAPANGEHEVTQVEARTEIHSAFVMACEALTSPSYAPRQRAETLMECHGRVLAAYGPGIPLTFSEFRAKLRGPLTDLLPPWVAPEGLEELTALDPDGHVTGDAFDLKWETDELQRIIRKLQGFNSRRVSVQALEDHLAQEEIFSIIKGRGEEQYRTDRSNLISHAAKPRTEIGELGLPMKAIGFYTEISYESVYHGWWFPCPVCRWPMKVSKLRSGDRDHHKVSCFYPRHAETGASYQFRPTAGEAPVLHPSGIETVPPQREVPLFLDAGGDIPQAVRAEGHIALKRGVWRYTCVPGLHELRLHEVLTRKLAGTGAEVRLWPMQDAFDHLVTVPTSDGGKHTFTVDLKDYSHGRVLARTIRRAEGDKGGAEWLVVPDHRANQVPLLTGVCAEYDMKATTMTEFSEMVCRTAGADWL